MHSSLLLPLHLCPGLRTIKVFYSWLRGGYEPLWELPSSSFTVSQQMASMLCSTFIFFLWSVLISVNTTCNTENQEFCSGTTLPFFFLTWYGKHLTSSLPHTWRALDSRQGHSPKVLQNLKCPSRFLLHPDLSTHHPGLSCSLRLCRTGPCHRDTSL